MVLYDSAWMRTTKYDHIWDAWHGAMRWVPHPIVIHKSVIVGADSDHNRLCLHCQHEADETEDANILKTSYLHFELLVQVSLHTHPTTTIQAQTGTPVNTHTHPSNPGKKTKKTLDFSFSGLPPPQKRTKYMHGILIWYIYIHINCLHSRHPTLTIQDPAVPL